MIHRHLRWELMFPHWCIIYSVRWDKKLSKAISHKIILSSEMTLKSKPILLRIRLIYYLDSTSKKVIKGRLHDLFILIDRKNPLDPKNPRDPFSREKVRLWIRVVTVITMAVKKAWWEVAARWLIYRTIRIIRRGRPPWQWRKS
jgi:hypothetical protein